MPEATGALAEDTPPVRYSACRSRAAGLAVFRVWRDFSGLIYRVRFQRRSVIDEPCRTATRRSKTKEKEAATMGGGGIGLDMDIMSLASSMVRHAAPARMPGPARA